ncbi:MAG TPA: HAMP domain-containing histidine kinase [Candidatus Anaerobutyricum avicola]|nr:HAMP domain-containing histidine kinase [Candidatus Anaerobutyricum avicola]
MLLSALSALRTADEADRERFIHMMYSEGKRMSRLIEDMLFLANSDANAWRLSMEDTALDTLLLDVFEKYEPEAAKKEHPLSISLPKEEIPLCCCDGQRITQVLCILMDNAFSHTPAGSRVALSLSVMEHHFILKVSDNGPGIPDAEKEKVFERFYRAEDSRTDKEHFGLGLCIAKEIIEAHGGQIRLTNNVPTGAVFTITLPGA